MPLHKPADEEPQEEFVELAEEEGDGEFVPVEVDGKGPGDDFKVTQIEDPADEDFEAVDLEATEEVVEEAVEEVETAEEDDGVKIEAEEEAEIAQEEPEVQVEAVEEVETAPDAEAVEPEQTDEVKIEDASGEVEPEESADGDIGESVEEEVELEVVTGRGVADRYKKGSKPMTPGRKRMRAAMILSLPVIFIGIVAAGFLIKKDDLQDDLDEEVCLWTISFRRMHIIDTPTVEKPKPPLEAVQAQGADPTEPTTPTAASDNPVLKEYEKLLSETRKSIVDHDVLRERMKAKAQEAGLEEANDEIKKPFHDEATAMVARIKEARAALDDLAAKLKDGPPSPVTEKSHGKAGADLNRILVNLEIFAGDTRPARKTTGEPLATSVRPRVGGTKPEVEPVPPTEPPPTEPKDPPKPAEPAEPKDTPKPAEPKDTPKPAEPAPAEPKDTPKPAEPKDTPKPAEPKDTPKPAEPAPPEPKDTPKPAEPVPAEPTVEPAPSPAEGPAPVPAVEPVPPAPSPVETPAPRESRSAETLIRDGSRLVVKSSESIMKLMETKLPENASNLLQLRLEAEDALAGLDDAEFKFGRAMNDLKTQKERTEEVKKIEGNISRLRELRQAFIDDFVRKLDRKTGRR